jgi:hypothetical protein
LYRGIEKYLEDLTAMTIKIMVSWVVPLCSSEVAFFIAGRFNPDDSTLQNLRIYKYIKSLLKEMEG